MIRIEAHLAEDLEMIEGDSNQLEQMLMNLGTNARDAMPDGGTLIIETSNVALDEEYCKQHPETLPGRYVLLRVSDMGHGIDKDTLRQIFDPFFTTKNVGKGTGLGLSAVFGIVEGHGGHITCHSDPGKGTAFNIYLPAFIHERSESIPEKRFLEDIQGGNEIILIVDDEPGIRDIGSQALSKQGYTVLTAVSGEEALNIYNRHRDKGKDIDLVILDIGMPGMGGQKCLKELLKIDPGAKVIIASGYSDNDYLNEALSSGALGFATKPFKKAEFLKIVREVLDHHTSKK